MQIVKMENIVILLSNMVCDHNHNYGNILPQTKLLIKIVVVAIFGIILATLNVFKYIYSNNTNTKIPQNTPETKLAKPALRNHVNNSQNLRIVICTMLCESGT